MAYDFLGMIPVASAIFERNFWNRCKDRKAKIPEPIDFILHRDFCNNLDDINLRFVVHCTQLVCDRASQMVARRKQVV